MGTVSNQMMHQNQPQNNHQNNHNASIVLVDNSFISPQIQQIQHDMQQISNPFQSQPMFSMNDIQNEHQNNNVIDLTGNDEEEDDEEEEEKEEFVPWQDSDI